MTDSLQCTGCGAVLQADDPAKPGYVPQEALERERALCRRCFRIKHYNEAADVAMDAEEYFRMLGHIAATDSLVLHIVDIFDFEGSLIGGLRRWVGGNPVLLAVNKIDLLPKSVNPNRIVDWVRRQTKEQGLKVLDVALCSAKRNLGFDRLIDMLERYRGGKDVYVVGATNAGKSSLINRLIRDYSELEEELTVSRYPGTTLNMIRIPLDDGRFIIDTPGIVYRYRLTEIVPKPVLGAIVPEKPLKPVVYQLNDRQTLFFGGLARFDFVRGEPQSFTCYVSNALRVHRTKLERADELYAKAKGGLLAPPTAEQSEALPPWTKHTFSIGRGSKKDIAISGLGWITVNGRSGAEVVLHAPRGVRVAVRDALI